MTWVTRSFLTPLSDTIIYMSVQEMQVFFQKIQNLIPKAALSAIQQLTLFFTELRFCHKAGIHQRPIGF